MAIQDYIDDTARSVAFLSRVPVPQRHFIGHDGRLSRAVRAFPLAGVLIVLPAAALAALLSAFHAPPLLVAFATLAVQVLVTGALHEDGLSDSADGIGGGRDRESALAIMKDSRIGSYGAVALILSFGLRAAAIAALAAALSPSGLGMALLAVAAASRTAMVWHWSLLPPARQGGVAASVGEPDGGATIVALASGILLAAALLLPHGSVLALVLALVLAVAAVIAFNRLALGKIGGHTGDTIGATQQLAEMSVLFALALAL
ncbi:adenosylcobinamide-GDP ribazoletransferase [Shinella granuli]|uniref:Adenosylcobinamide-GDP ribazoletransferase n=1 Tax=Shinella granuli TaxID=323621 RepID=A0A4R2CMB2_SHIGR|nr:adenosylcobinamide-GDP ribazoletransferase [Shinella granuli]TCN42297.1 cobalamin-5'-phosphate synthase [Shinella granuli]